MVEGKAVIAPPPEEAPAAGMNLMEALQESVGAAHDASASPARRPRRRRAS